MRHRQKLRSVLASVFLAILTACGGGGGGGDGGDKPTNSAPVATAQSVVTTQNTNVDIILEGTGVNGDGLSYAITSGPSSGALGGSVPNLIYIPNEDFSGDDSFTFTVDDGKATSAAATVAIAVQDVTPDTFSFTDQIDVPFNERATSAPVKINGISSATPVSISSGGEYAIANGTFTFTAAANGTVNNDDSIVVRVTPSTTAGAVTDVILTVGGVSDTFSVTTVHDTTPDEFNFFDQTDAVSGDWVLSTAISITGINSPTEVKIFDGEYSIDGGVTYTTAERNVNADDSIMVRVIASAVGLETVAATLTVGGISDTFSVTSANDLIPDPFTFTEQVNVPPEEAIHSDPICVAGINNATDITIVDGQYAVVGDVLFFTKDGGSVIAGDCVVVQVTSSVNLLGSAAATLTIGGVSNSFNVVTTNDITPPTAHILFPSAQTLSEKSSIKLRGIAADADSTIETVTVNDVAATSDDGFKNWMVEYPLLEGVNQLAVSATDSVGNTTSNTSSVTVEHRPLFSDTNSIRYDNHASRLLLLGRFTHLYDFNASTLRYSRVSSSYQRRDTINPMLSPRAFDIDETNAYVIDSGTTERILKVDLATGDRTEHTKDTEAVAAHIMLEPYYLEIDVDSKFAYVLDSTLEGSGRKAILRFDLVTSEARVVSDNTFPGPDFNQPDSIALDKKNNRILLAEMSKNTIIAVDLETGERSVFSGPKVPGDNLLDQPKAIALDKDKERAVVFSRNSQQLISISLAEGSEGHQTVLADGVTIPGASGNSAMDMVYDAGDDRVFISRGNGSTIYAVDLTGGAVSDFSSDTIPNADNPLSGPIGLTIDHASTPPRLLVTNLASDRVIAVALKSDTQTVAGARTVVSDSTIENNPLGYRPRGIGMGPDNTAYLVDNKQDALVRVDLGSGEREIIADNSVFDVNKTFNELTAITSDPVNDRSLVLDRGSKAVISIGHNIAEREVISALSIPNSDNPFVDPGDLVIVGDHGFVLDKGNRSILRVDLSSSTNDGARTVFSSPTIPSNHSPLNSPKKMVLDNTGDAPRLLVLVPGGVMAVSLTDGSRAVLSSSSFPDSEHLLSFFVSDITLDAANNQALVLDELYDVVIAVDLASGARTPYAGGFPSQQPTLHQPTTVRFDKSKNALWVLANNNRELFKVEMATGNRVRLVTEPTLLRMNDFIIIDGVKQRAVLAATNALWEVDLETGAAKLIPQPDNPFGALSSLALADTNHVYVTDATQNVIFKVNLDSGERTEVPSNASNDEHPLDYPNSLVFDQEKGRLLLADGGQIMAVDVESGARSIIFAKTSSRYSALVLEKDNDPLKESDRLLVIDSRSLYAFDFSTEKMTLITQNITSSSTDGATLTSTPGQIVVGGHAAAGLLLVDLVSGERVVLSK